MGVQTYVYGNLAFEGVDHEGVHLAAGDGASEAEITLSFTRAAALRIAIGDGLDGFLGRQTRGAINAVTDAALSAEEAAPPAFNVIDPPRDTPEASAREDAWDVMTFTRWIPTGDPNYAILEIAGLRVFIPMVWLNDHWEVWTDTKHTEQVFAFDTMARGAFVVRDFRKMLEAQTHESVQEA